jgi:hypothetical protein
LKENKNEKEKQERKRKRKRKQNFTWAKAIRPNALGVGCVYLPLSASK